MMTAFDYIRQLNFTSVVLRLSLSMIIGGMIGMERGRKRRAAGFRTYMLVCLGAALSMILSQYFSWMLEPVWAANTAIIGRTTDVSRIGASVIGGVGFLGTGTIIVTDRQEVKGLTTAAGLWASASLGIAIGAGCYECVIVAFALMFLCIRFLPILESYMIENARNINFFVEFTSLEDVGDIITCIKKQDVQIYDVDIDRGSDTQSGYPSAIFSTRMNKKTAHAQLMAEISALETVRSINEL